MFASVVFFSSFLVLSQVSGWEERLRNDLFCIKWDVKPQLSRQKLDLPCGEVLTECILCC